MNSSSWLASMLLAAACAAAVGFVSPVQAPGQALNDQEMRTWTDATGKFRVEAVLISSDERQVQLKKKDGAVVTVPLEKLSAADRDYVASLAEPAGPIEAAPANVEPPVPVNAVASVALPTPTVNIPPADVSRSVDSEASPEGDLTGSASPSSGDASPGAAEISYAETSEAVPTTADWFTQSTIPPETVTRLLNEVWALAPAEALTRATAMEEQIKQASAEGKSALRLVQAATYERAEREGHALDIYRLLASGEPQSPYGASASFRVRQLEKKSDAEGEFYWELVEMAAPSPRNGWYLHGGEWVWSTDRNAALQALVDRRADRLSFRFFSQVQSYSPFSTQYGYLFVLMAITIGVKVLALPLHARSAKLICQLRRLRPQIQTLQQIYRNDFVELQKQLQSLYRAEGVNAASGCLVALLDLVFVIAVLVSLSVYSPQMLLDGASFLWAPNVTEFNWGLGLAYLGLTFSITLLQTQLGLLQVNGAQAGCGAVFSGAIILGIAWYWQWPAYVFVFWLLLAIVGQFLTLLLIPTVTALEKR